MTDSFATELDLPAPIEEVFRHLTDPVAMTRWMGQHATAHPGRRRKRPRPRPLEPGRCPLTAGA